MQTILKNLNQKQIYATTTQQSLVNISNHQSPLHRFEFSFS